MNQQLNINTLPLIGAACLALPPGTAVRTGVDDPCIRSGWDTLLKHHPYHTALRSLHQLLIRLHAEIEHGSISIEDASYLYQQARDEVLTDQRFNFSPHVAENMESNTLDIIKRPN